MDYKVLYRKYRPDNFTNIIGQDYMVSILKNSIKQNKISHAYIFSGPRGTGKTSTAKVFAKAINCLNLTEDGPCNECESCIHFKENADIIEIDAASNNGVDEIREIINNIKLAPAYSKYKVYIIDEVHMLSTSAFNALLLTLEEPPKHVVFILATTNIESVPITILSRCQRFDFHKISIEDIINRLKYVTEQENIAIEQDALEEIAYISEGGMRDALSILDQLSSYNAKITNDTVIKHFGSVSKKQIDTLYNCIKTNEVTSFNKIMSDFKNLSIDYKYLIKKMLEKIEEEAIKSKKDANYDGLPYENLKDMVYTLADISNYVNININPYTLIEITLLKYFNNPVNPTAKIEITPKEENDIPIIRKDPSPPRLSNNKISQEIEKLINIRVNNCFVNAKREYLQNIQNKWPNFLQQIDNKVLLNLLIDSKIIAASDKIIIISHSLQSTVNLLNQNIEQISECYKEIFNEEYKFIAVTDLKWSELKKEYINNLKNNYKYTFIEEDEKEEKINSIDNIEKTALEIFDKSKLEIE